MLIDFCDVCGSFDSVFRKNGKHICKPCINLGKSFESIENKQEVEKIPQVKKVTREKLPKLSSIKSIKHPRKSGVTKKKIASLLEFFQKHPTESFTLNSLWKTELNQVYKNERSLNRDLFKLVKQEKIFLRKQYLAGIRKESVYSIDKKVLESFAEEIPNTFEIILEILNRENYICIKDLAERIGMSSVNVAKVVRSHNTKLISVWRVKNCHYYTLNTDFKKEIFCRDFPNAEMN